MERARTGFLDKASALAKFKRTNGFNISSRNSVSGYILCRKLEKILKAEFTQEMFKANEKKHMRYVRANSKEERIGMFMENLNDLSTETLTTILAVYQAKGINALVLELHRPKNYFSRKTAEA